MPALVFAVIAVIGAAVSVRRQRDRDAPRSRSTR
jgi:hypothetical protein